MCHPSATWSQLTWNREAAVCLKLAVFRNRVNKVSQIGKLFGGLFFFARRVGMRVWTWRAWGEASFRGLEHSRGGSLLSGVCLLSFELWVGRFVQEELTLSVELLNPTLRLST